MTSKLAVVDFYVGHCAAGLASPTVATKHLVAELFVYVRIEPQARLLRLDLIHDTFSVTWCRNVSCSWSGRKLKNRSADCSRTSGFSFSKFAPAKKSAQIISKQ